MHRAEPSQARLRQAIGATRRACYKARSREGCRVTPRSPRARRDSARTTAIALSAVTLLLLDLNSTQDVVHLVGVLGLLILSLGIHEAAHAWVAWRCGDSTAKDLGRMTLDPIVHIDLVWTILIPLGLYVFSKGAFVFGGAKPVPVDYHRLRNPNRDMMLVALAGPISNVLLAVLFLLIRKTMVDLGGMAASELLVQVVTSAVYFNLLLAAFNMIPIPPLDGSRVMSYLLRGPAREAYESFERFGIVIVIVLVATRSLHGILWSAMEAAYGFLDTITGGPWT